MRADVKSVVRCIVVYVGVVAVLGAMARAQSPCLAQARAAVVSVSVTRTNNTRIGLGSGFYVSHTGRLVTSWHVIRNAAAITISTAMGQVLPATIVAEDADYDLVVLQTDGASLLALELAAAEHAVPGRRVTLLAPPTVASQTFRHGLIMAAQSIFGREMLQITTQLLPGLSGSPLVNAQGQVVGVANGQYVGRTDAENINFAVPVTPVRQLLAKIPAAPPAPVRVAAAK